MASCSIGGYEIIIPRRAIDQQRELCSPNHPITEQCKHKLIFQTPLPLCFHQQEGRIHSRQDWPFHKSSAPLPM
jgi:hypothetical protein